MPKIPYAPLQAVVHHFEELVKACEEYQELLEQKRPERYRGKGPGGAYVKGRWQADGTYPAPEYGSPDFRDFAANRQILKAKGQARALQELLEGEAYDRMRSLVDSLGVLESALKGEWV